MANMEQNLRNPNKPLHPKKRLISVFRPCIFISTVDPLILQRAPKWKNVFDVSFLHRAPGLCSNSFKERHGRVVPNKEHPVAEWFAFIHYFGIWEQKRLKCHGNMIQPPQITNNSGKPYVKRQQRLKCTTDITRHLEFTCKIIEVSLSSSLELHFSHPPFTPSTPSSALRNVSRQSRHDQLVKVFIEAFDALRYWCTSDVAEPIHEEKASASAAVASFFGKEASSTQACQRKLAQKRFLWV